MQMQRIAAQNIKSVQYCPIRKMLEVQFSDESRTYQYFDVPEDVWYHLKNVPNIDIFFNSQIVSKYHVVCRDKGKIISVLTKGK